MERNSKKETLVTLAVLTAIVLIVMGAVIFNRKKPNNDSTASDSTGSASLETQPEDTADTTVTEQMPTASADNESSNSAYQDGTYTATGSYSTPEDTESITVTVTLKDDVVTATSATATMTSHESKEYAGEFLSNYKSSVVGKKIAGLKLSRIAGSSLTSQGFNRAIESIKNQAQS